MANEVVFWRGTQTQYDALSFKSVDTLYFTTDTGFLYRGSNQQAVGFKVVTELPGTGAVQGCLYFNTTNWQISYYNGSEFKPLSLEVTTEITSSATDTQICTAKATYDFVNAQIAGIGRLKPAVADLTALRAVPTTGESTKDKDLILSEIPGNLYRYDAESTGADDNDRTIKPDDVQVTDPGRWIKMFTPTTITAGNGISVSNSTVSVNIDVNTFEFDSQTKALKLKSSVLDKKLNRTDVPVRENNTTYAIGARVAFPAKYGEGGSVVEPAKFGWVLKCTGAGTTGTVLPDWPSSITSGITTLTDGTVVWTLYDTTVTTDTSDKMDKVKGATEDDLVAFDANGNAKDSHKKAGGDEFTSGDVQRKTTLATEFATAGAIDAAKLRWTVEA